MEDIVIYGAGGYIGGLTARTAVQRGLRPTLAGRASDRLAGLARELDLPMHAAELDDAAAADRMLGGTRVVLNAAGPFADTQQPLLDACLRTGTDYLDLAGEYPEFLAVAARDAELSAAGVLGMPGAGFGVVPTDAMAAHLVRRLPSATRLELSFVTTGGLSRGTLGTLLSGLPTPGAQRVQGRLVPARAASRRRRVAAGDRRRALVVTNPWRADVVSAAASTGVRTISTFMAVPAPVRLAMRLGPRVPWLFTGRPSRRLQAALLRRLPAGPTPEQLAAGSSVVHGLATDDAGGRAEAVLTGPEPYLYTAHVAVELLARTAAGAAVSGYRTPAQLYGPDIALAAPGVELRDIETRVRA